MILGVGLDLVETERFGEALERHGGRFEQRVFTPGERADCEQGDRLQKLASRFAVKEACMKALGTGWTRGIGFQQIEVIRGPGGAPELKLHGAAAERAKSIGARRTHVSLTHQPGSAAAVVVLEG